MVAGLPKIIAGIRLRVWPRAETAQSKPLRWKITALFFGRSESILRRYEFGDYRRGHKELRDIMGFADWVPVFLFGF